MESHRDDIGLIDNVCVEKKMLDVQQAVEFSTTLFIEKLSLVFFYRSAYALRNMMDICILAGDSQVLAATVV